jgi:ABC-type molybdenum transport system ATPase subunit/photorepair protein PhrA
VDPAQPGNPDTLPAPGWYLAIEGPTGAGKTTLALMVCADRRVRRRFRGGVHVVTVGRDTRAPDMKQKIMQCRGVA